jgi:hypothetical protein
MNMPADAQLAALIAALDGVKLAASQLLGSAAAPTAAGDPVTGLVIEGRASLLRNPAVAAGLVRALARLGAQHAQTPAGAELLERLVRSDGVERLRTLWETVTFNVLEEVESPSVVPSAWLDLVLDTLADDGLERAVRQAGPWGYA